MKQKIANGVVIIIIIVVMIALLFPWPKEFSKEFAGVRYQLGQEGGDYFESVKVSFSGEYHKSYFGLIKDRYTGNIYIDGVDVYKDNEFELGFNENGSTVITHRCFVPEQRAMKNFYYGNLYLNEDLDTLYIELFIDHNTPKTNGFVIAAPAGSKTEAVEITNSFISD